jgi:hypothetical protein
MLTKARKPREVACSAEGFALLTCITTGDPARCEELRKALELCKLVQSGAPVPREVIRERSFIYHFVNMSKQPWKWT